MDKIINLAFGILKNKNTAMQVKNKKKSGKRLLQEKDWLRLFALGFKPSMFWLDDKAGFCDLLYTYFVEKFNEDMQPDLSPNIPTKRIREEAELICEEYFRLFTNSKAEALTLAENKMDWDCISCNDSRYPMAFRFINNKPSLIFMAGPLKSYLNHPLMLAVVGTRRMTSYGERVTELLFSSLQNSKLPIISGMAVGIDACAHKLAIEYKLPNIAFMPSGLDICYPYQNLNIYKHLQENGLLLSQFPFGVLPKPFYFHERNRLMAALAKFIIVPKQALLVVPWLRLIMGLKCQIKSFMWPRALFLTKLVLDVISC